MMNNQSLLLGDSAAMNQTRRQKRMALVTPRDGYADAKTAYDEMMERKQMRGAQHREIKLSHYADRAGLTFDECTLMNFADAELRRSIKSGEIKGGFAGEGMSFPIWSPESVNDAWRSVGRSNQSKEKVQRNILRLARKFNLTSGLPKAVRDRMRKGGSGMPEFAEEETNFPGQFKKKGPCYKDL